MIQQSFGNFVFYSFPKAKKFKGQSKNNLMSPTKYQPNIDIIKHKQPNQRFSLSRRFSISKKINNQKCNSKKKKRKQQSRKSNKMQQLYKIQQKENILKRKKQKQKKNENLKNIQKIYSNQQRFKSKNNNQIQSIQQLKEKCLSSDINDFYFEAQEKAIQDINICQDKNIYKQMSTIKMGDDLVEIQKNLQKKKKNQKKIKKKYSNSNYKKRKFSIKFPDRKKNSIPVNFKAQQQIYNNGYLQLDSKNIKKFYIKKRGFCQSQDQNQLQKNKEQDIRQKENKNYLPQIDQNYYHEEDFFDKKVTQQRTQRLNNKEEYNQYVDFWKVTFKKQKNTKFGIEERKEFFQFQENPSPCKYDQESIFEQNIKKKIGYSLYPKLIRNFNNKIPGPGQYKLITNYQNLLKKKNHIKSQQKNIKNIFFNTERRFYQNEKNKLGPGQYKANLINKQKNTKFAKARRFTYKYSDNPSPGKYNIKSKFYEIPDYIQKNLQNIIQQ